MTTQLDSIGAISLFVDDVSRAKAWYENVFARPVVFEDDASAVFKFGGTLVNLLARSSAHELIEPAVLAGPQTGSHFQMTIWVDAVDAVCAELAGRGVVLVNGPIDREWGQRTACFADPDGHLWELAQTLT